jgi:hypothetical protein
LSLSLDSPLPLCSPCRRSSAVSVCRSARCGFCVCEQQIKRIEMWPSGIPSAAADCALQACALHLEPPPTASPRASTDSKGAREAACTVVSWIRISGLTVTVPSRLPREIGEGMSEPLNDVQVCKVVTTRATAVEHTGPMSVPCNPLPGIREGRVRATAVGSAAMRSGCRCQRPLWCIGSGVGGVH